MGSWGLHLNPVDHGPWQWLATKSLRRAIQRELRVWVCILYRRWWYSLASASHPFLPLFAIFFAQDHHCEYGLAWISMQLQDQGFDQSSQRYGSCKWITRSRIDKDFLSNATLMLYRGFWAEYTRSQTNVCRQRGGSIGAASHLPRPQRDLHHPRQRWVYVSLRCLYQRYTFDHCLRWWCTDFNAYWEHRL